MKNFGKIIGYQSVKRELDMICDMLREPEKYQKLGGKSLQGVLLCGEPGVGKTLFANCFIEACGLPSFTFRKSEEGAKFASSLAEVFRKAREAAPSIILLDDVDKYANEDLFHKDALEYVAIQTGIDSVKGQNVFVIATANDFRKLPDSLLRAGRLGKQIEISTPKGKDAVEIVRYFLSQKQFVGDIDVEDVAKILDGHSCAELENIINEAAIYAGYDNRDKIEMRDVISASMRVIFNAPSTLQEENNEFDESTAVHEAGHAVVAEILEPESVTLVSIENRGGNVGGFTRYYQEDKYWHSKKYMENRVIALLAGKAATEICFAEDDVGANSDIHRALDIVTRFVDNYCCYGFDRFEFQQKSSNELLNRKESLIFSELEKYYFKAKKILISNREFLDKLTKALIEKKTLTCHEVEEIKKSCKIVEGLQ